MTVEIPLTHGYVAIVDDQDADLAELNWHVIVKKDKAYALRRFPGKGKVLMHRIILERAISKPLIKGEIGDHANGDSCDNRRSNLRLATASQNNQNKRIMKTNKTGFKGVSKHQGRFRAIIKINRKGIYLGHFDTCEEAHEAYKKAARELFGEFARFE